jgi:integrase
VGVSRVFARGGSLYVKVQSSRKGIVPHNVALGLDAESTAEAEAKRFAIVRALREGSYKPPVQNLSFAEFKKKFHEHYVAAAGPDRKAIRQRTWERSYGVQIGLMFDWFAARGLRSPRDVTSRHCEIFRDERLSCGKALATVRAAQLVGHAAWAWAARRDIVSQNPWHGMRFPKATKQDPRNLSPLEIQLVFPLARAESQDFHARMALALYSGLRLGECDNLQQRDLVWGDQGFIRLGPGKDGEPRTTLFPSELQSILAGLRKPLEPRSLVLGPCDHKRLQKFVVRLARHLAAPFTFHDLRKTFASLLAQRGVPTTRIRDYLGHSSVATTETYYVGRCHQAVHEDGATLAFGLAQTAPACTKSGAIAGSTAALAKAKHA